MVPFCAFEQEPVVDRIVQVVPSPYSSCYGGLVVPNPPKGHLVERYSF